MKSNNNNAKTAAQAAVLIGTSTDKAVEFFLFRGEVYRIGRGWIPDIYGIPCGMRWECSLANFERYRSSVYSWVV